MINKEKADILIVGVGGQGILLASEIISSVCLEAGYDVKQSEVHGMAQRGGSVSSHVRYGDVVYSPTIERGRADILLSFELLEALRWIEFLKPEGTAIVNNMKITPMPVADGSERYPDNIRQKLEKRCKELVLVDGNSIAVKAGHIKTVNIALLGVFSKYLPFDTNMWKKSIVERVPVKTKEINLIAFDSGRNAN
ncbi:indolepyruvate oxidoreductase subunit beta [candidate division KSB1 bacterium]|nr:indolepyruvate oxidoreductase subunit beta [candidate division KSB1 bacterium]